MGNGTGNREARWILSSGIFAVLLGILACVLTAATASGGPYWTASVQLSLFTLTAAAIGALLGFIFGIPKLADVENPSGRARYVFNSNLAQISDWLTKVLVGVGLVQVSRLPDGLEALGNSLGSSLDLPNAEVTSYVIVVYGATVGFIWGWLVVVFPLRELLEDQAAKYSDEAEAIGRAPNELHEVKSSPADAEQAILRSRPDKRRVTSSRRNYRVLWVDDFPGNNTSLVESFTSAGIDVVQVTSTDSARGFLDSANLVITDLGRIENGENNPNAGVDLIEAIPRQDGKLNPPVVVYAGSRALADRDKLIDRGVSEVTASPSRVYEVVFQLLANLDAASPP